MSIVQSFIIHVPDDKIERLKQKLALCDFPHQSHPSPKDSPWKRGPPLQEVQRLVTVWQTTYDWRTVEKGLNTLSHFSAPIQVDGFDAHNVHFIHEKSEQDDAIPLLFLHGWPGSFIEVTKMLPDLVEGDADTRCSFNVVAPSLIDFGFSDASKVSGKSFSII